MFSKDANTIIEAATSPRLHRRSLLKLTGGGIAAGALGTALVGCNREADDSGSTAPTIDPSKKVKLPEPVAGVLYPEPYKGPKAYDLKPFSDGSKTLKIVVRQDATRVGDYKTNVFSKWLEKRTGLKIEYQAVSTTGADGSTDLSKINAMLATGGDGLPDAFLGIPLTPAQISLYGSQGWFQDVTELVQVYSPQQAQMLTDHPTLKRNITALDGKIYQLSGINECFHCNTSASKAFINQTYLDKIGAKNPETIEDFRDVLKEFKARNPSGKNGFMPFIGANPTWDPMDVWFVNPFTYNPGEPWLRLNQGKVEFVANTDGWRQGMAYMRSLYDDGTLTKQSFSITSDELTKLGDQGLIGVARSFYWGAFISIDYAKDALWKQYVPVMPLKGPSGKGIASNTYQVRPQISLIITKNCKNPELLAQWGDYQLELEATMRAYDTGGEKGVQWDWAKAGAKGLDGRQAIYNQLPSTDGKKDDDAVGRGWNQLSLMNRSLDYRNGQQFDDANPTFEGDLYQVSKKYEPFWQPQDEELPAPLFNETDQARVSEIAANFKNHVVNSYGKFATAGLNVNDDKVWGDYVSQFDKMGLKEYLELYQKAHDAAPK